MREALNERFNAGFVGSGAYSDNLELDPKWNWLSDPILDLTMTLFKNALMLRVQEEAVLPFLSFRYSGSTRITPSVSREEGRQTAASSQSSSVSGF